MNVRTILTDIAADKGDAILGTGKSSKPKMTAVDDIPHPVPEAEFVPDPNINPLPEGAVIDRFHLASTKVMTFCERYAAHGCPSRAAREAGYSAKGACTAAYRLLKREDIKLTIEALRCEAVARADADMDYVVKSLIAESEYFGEGSSPAARIRALELLGKWMGMFKEQIEHSGKVGVVPSLEDVLEARQKMIMFRREIQGDKPPDEPLAISDK